MKLVVPRMSNGVPATTAIKSPRRTSFSSSSRFSATAVSASMLRTRGMLRGITPQYKLIRRRASRFGEKPTMSAWGRYLETRRAVEPVSVKAAMKIGRASCRERGESEVVDGVVKKKRKNVDIEGDR